MHKVFTIIALLGWNLAFTQSISLNDNWHFSKDRQNWENVAIPHTWNNLDAHDDERGMYMGDAFYKKQLYLGSTKNNQVFLKFEGVNQVTELFINGVSVGKHLGGYTAFAFEITDQINFDQENEILIKVNNSVDQNIPPMSADFTFYGGIYRDIFLIRKSTTHFDLLDGSTKGVYISQKTNEEMSILSIRSSIQSNVSERSALNINIYDPNMNLVASKTEKMKLQIGSNNVVSTIQIDNPILWSVHEPNLYTTVMQITDRKGEIILDEFIYKTGLRWFELDSNLAFNLNGEKIKLIGANRHQDFEGLGNALPDAIHRRDIELLKEMGGNFIRIAHYPQDPAILEACDELGILVWEEIPIVNYITLNSSFTENSVGMLQEMIRQHYNHSSVVTWGFMNEVLLRPNKAYSLNEGLTEDNYFPQVNALHKKLDSVVRAEDPDRLVTIAHHAAYDRYEKAGLNDMADLIGWNIYYGWYGNDPQWNRAGEFFDMFNNRHPDKGIIVAEYGAGADPRLHAVEPKRFDFTMEWQTRYHANYLRQINEREHVTGATIWNFIDFGSEGRSDAVPRINSKGILTVDRQKKDSYLFYQAALLKEPYLQIGNTHWRKRTGVASDGKLNQPIHVFTNQPSIEIELNSKPLGTFETKDFQVITNIPFIAGENIVKVSSGSIEDIAYYHAVIIPEDLKSIEPKQINFSMNLGSHVYFHHPSTDVVWIPERVYSEGSFGYLGGEQMWSRGWKVGVGSEIFGSDMEPVYQTHRDTISAFRMDVPDGLYEITLHFAEIYAKEKREQLANNLGSGREESISNVSRAFNFRINNQDPVRIEGLADFMATPIKKRVFVTGGTGIDIQFDALKGTSFLSGIEIKGL